MRGFESHSCQETFWTRWRRAFSWQILSYWNVNSRWQCKVRENKKIAKSSVVDKRAVGNCTKKIPSRDMWNTNVRMGLKANLYRRMTQTVQQTKSLICKFYPIEKAHIIQKKCRRKPGRMAERSKAPDSRISSVENSGTHVCPWVRIPLLSDNVLNTMRQSLQPTNSVTQER